MAVRRNMRQPLGPTSQENAPGTPNVDLMNGMKPKVAPTTPGLAQPKLAIGRANQLRRSPIPVNPQRMEQMMMGQVKNPSKGGIANMPEDQWKQLLASFGVFDG